MSIHNLTEGFMISLPLYFALRSRTTAFWTAALLGGLSQPMGAVIGLALLHNVDSDQENLIFGITFGLVSGMMCLITVQVKPDTEIFGSVSLTKRKKFLISSLVYSCRACCLKPSRQIPRIATYCFGSSWASFSWV